MEPHVHSQALGQMRKGPGRMHRVCLGPRGYRMVLEGGYGLTHQRNGCPPNNQEDPPPQAQKAGSPAAAGQAARHEGYGTWSRHHERSARRLRPRMRGAWRDTGTLWVIGSTT